MPNLQTDTGRKKVANVGNIFIFVRRVELFFVLQPWCCFSQVFWFTYFVGDWAVGCESILSPLVGGLVRCLLHTRSCLPQSWLSFRKVRWCRWVVDQLYVCVTCSCCMNWKWVMVRIMCGEGVGRRRDRGRARAQRHVYAWQEACKNVDEKTRLKTSWTLKAKDALDSLAMKTPTKFTGNYRFRYKNV